MVFDPLTWIYDLNGYQVVGPTGMEGWGQLKPNRWQFKLREGVTFRNGAPWNANQAKFWIDFFGDEETIGHHNSNDFSFHGVISGEVIDDYTLDVVCDNPCPILPRTTIFTKFQGVGWFEQASEDDVERFTVGLGPYKIVEWRSGVEVELEANEDYNPNPNTIYSRTPSIKTVVQQWRNEPLVRASALETGEVDWAEIAIEDPDRVPEWKSGTNNEVYISTIDTVHHPELSKRGVREALALAIDCPVLMREIFDDLLECHTNLPQDGTVGITEENTAPYPYDPARARELQAEAEYHEDNEINVFIRANRVPKDVEYAEAVLTSWWEVGINANLEVVESSVRSAKQRSNCGHQRTREDFENAAGADLHEKCKNLGLGPPEFASQHIVESAASTESLDYSRRALLRHSCYSCSSGVRYQDLQEAIQEVIEPPTGESPRQHIEAIANRVHDDLHSVPKFPGGADLRIVRQPGVGVPLCSAYQGKHDVLQPITCLVDQAFPAPWG